MVLWLGFPHKTDPNPVLRKATRCLQVGAIVKVSICSISGPNYIWLHMKGASN